jgi:PEP-CTERM motif
MKSKLAILALVLVCLCGRAQADSTAAAAATLDWSGLTFTVSGSLVATEVLLPGTLSCSFASEAGASGLASTPVGGESGGCKESLNTSASSAYSALSGNAAAQAATVNGFLTSSSQAATTSSVWNRNFGQSSAFTGFAFGFSGSGVGSLIVTIPYTLSVACSVPPDPNQTATANGSVSLMIGPGVEPGTPSSSNSVSCKTNPGITTGFLTVSEDFDNPHGERLVSVDAIAQTSAGASVPEPGTLGLVTIGFVLIWRRFENGKR